MTRSKPITFLASAVVIPLAALAVAACGGGGAAAAAPPAAPAKSTTPPTQTATVRVANSPLGRILVDSAGRTLYLFKADSSAMSACSGACAIAWPPLRTGATPAVGGGANSALAGTISRSDGARQVTYNGHPLYTFVKDKKAGDVNGEGVTAFGAAWFAVSPRGNEISSKPARHASGSSSSRASKPAAPAAPKRDRAPTPPVSTAQPAPPVAQPAPPVAQPAPPVAKPTPPSNGIPQNNGGDGDSDNNGGPSDGDGDV